MYQARFPVGEIWETNFPNSFSSAWSGWCLQVNFSSVVLIGNQIIGVVVKPILLLRGMKNTCLLINWCPLQYPVTYYWWNHLTGCLSPPLRPYGVVHTVRCSDATWHTRHRTYERAVPSSGFPQLQKRFRWELVWCNGLVFSASSSRSPWMRVRPGKYCCLAYSYRQAVTWTLLCSGSERSLG